MHPSFPSLGRQFFVCKWGNWIQWPRSFLLALISCDHPSVKCFPYNYRSQQKCVSRHPLPMWYQVTALHFDQTFWERLLSQVLDCRPDSWVRLGTMLHILPLQGVVPVRRAIITTGSPWPALLLQHGRWYVRVDGTFTLACPVGKYKVHKGPRQSAGQ